MKLFVFTADSGTSPGNITDGLHLEGLDCHDSSTLCGIAWDGYPEEVDGDAPTCRNCIRIAKVIFRRYTKAQVVKWNDGGRE